jgi:hypothetical protein
VAERRQYQHPQQSTRDETPHQRTQFGWPHQKR